MSADVWLVRHGQTEWSQAGRHTGITDVPLTDEGREQARAAARLLAGHAFARVLASPRRRAAETAALLDVGQAVETCDALAEVDYGEYEGLTTPEIREQVPGWTLWTHGARGGETPDDAGHRADRVLAAAREAGGDVLLVAHGHIGRVLAARWLGQPAAFGAHLKLDTATVSVLGHERDVPVLRRWNAT